MGIPLFGLGLGGKSAAVTSQRHINMYAEAQPEQEKGALAFYGTPGLSLFASFGDTPIRGSITAGDFAYHVHRGVFWQVNNAGVKVNRGTLSTTSGRVDIAYNGTQILIVDGVSAYCYTIATNAFAVVASGLFANPTGVTFQDGYFICTFLDSGRFQTSSAYDGLTWDVLDFATAESNPDRIVRPIADHGEITLCGSDTTEFWGNTGGQDFPYSNQRGATLQFGLAAAWSLVKYNDSLAGLFKNAMGQVQVMMMRGHALTPLSSQEHSAIINAYAEVSDATAFSYMLGGHPMLQINFPTAGKSWLYDASTSLWTELQSGLAGGRHRAEIQIDYLGRTQVTDYESGNIYNLEADTYTDNGAPIKRQLISRHIFKGRNKTSLSGVQVNMEAGVGLAAGQGSEPQAMLRISKDNGKTWGNEMWRSIGKIGEYLARVYWNRLGSAYDWTFELTITDPVKVVILDGWLGDE